jgi:hypothetical protein
LRELDVPHVTAKSYADAVLAASGVGIVAVVGATFREVVLRAEALFAVTVASVEAFFVAFFGLADFFDAVSFLDATVFLVPTFLLAAMGFGAAFDLVALRVADASFGATAVCLTKNLLRSFAEANHLGAGPRPLHVAPDFGS